MKKYYPDKTCLYVLRIMIIITTLSLMFIDYYFLFFNLILMLVILTVFALSFILIMFWLPLYFSKTNYIITPHEIIRSTGFFVRIRQVMRVSAIQYVTLIATPFSKITGLNFIIINALGGNLFLLYLSKTDAEEILSTLTEAINNTDK